MNHIDPLECRRVFDGGQLDPTFGFQGASPIIDASEFETHEPLQILTDSSQRIYAIIKQEFRDPQASFLTRIQIYRQLRGGGEDRSFGDAGTKWLDSFVPADNFQAAIDPAGRMVILSGREITRLTAKGQLDKSFGRNGKATLATSAADAVSAMTLDTTGRVFLGGRRGNQPVVFRIAANSAEVDRTFNWTGTQPAPAGATALQSDVTLLRFVGGKLLAAASESYFVRRPEINPAITFRAVRTTGYQLTTAAALDPTYGTAGVSGDPLVSTDVTFQNPTKPLLIASDGRIFFYASAATDSDVVPESNSVISAIGQRQAAVRLHPNSVLREPFVLQSDGRILFNTDRAKIARDA